MKIQSINVNVGRKILHEQNEHSIEIGLQVNLEPEEDSESAYYSVKNMLEGQLDSWEHEMRSSQQPRLITIPEISGSDVPPLVTATEIKPKVAKTKKEFKKEQTIQKGDPDNMKPKEEQFQEEYICPNCGEEMKPKEGKDYYLCTKHWGYPDMIKKGIVKERKF